MAEFALGLTKTAVEGTVSRVKAAIDEEEKLKVRVQNDLVFITGEFQMMQSFLNVANKERAKNEVVRTWVRQVRDLAFDVEDGVELVVSLDIKSGWSWLWRVLPGCMAPPRAIDEAVAEIQRLKARVEDVSQRNTRYSLINDSGSSSNYYSKHGPVTTVSSPAPADFMLSATVDTCASSSTFDILREVWEAAGRMRRDMGDLRKLITNEGIDLEVISIWGGPGSAADHGKTHVIREAYNDPEICQEFKSRAWVKVMHPFNPDEFLKSLLTQFYSSSRRAKVLDAEFKKEMRAAVAEENDLMKAQLMWKVSDKQRYLVIVEALSTVAEWDTIRTYLPDSKNGSRIVVTTQQLGLALSCTGNPYQVSEIRQFSRGPSLCGFFSKLSGRRSDLGELIWLLRCGGVISVWGFGYSDESTLLDGVYMGITHKAKVFEGVEFERQNWVEVPYPFDLEVFSRRLFLNFHSYDLRAKEILAAGMVGDAGVIQGCHKFLHEDRCLIVINNLRSTDDWDKINTVFSFDLTTCSIVVTTNEERVARYCVDEDSRALSTHYLNSDLVLRQSIKGCQYYGIEASEASSRGRFFSNRRKEARDWMNKFKFVVDPKGNYSTRLRNHLQGPGVISLYGVPGAWKSALAREIYYEQMLVAASEDDMPPMRARDGSKIVDLEFTEYSWVNVPQPFNFDDLCLRLFLDFYSDKIEAKQTAVFSIMEGRQDPIEGCLNFLRQYKCFVVIDGLQSRDDWDLIKDVLLSQPTKGCILVITDEESVATKCVHKKDRMIIINGEDRSVASHPLIKKEGYSDQDRSRDFSGRMTEAREWSKKFELIGHQNLHRRILRRIRRRKGGVISVWGIAGVGKSDLVRNIYYNHMIGLYWGRFTKYSWVDVPESLNMTDLSRRILIDFDSDGLEAKETAAVGMMEGQDPIQGCRELLHQHQCFVVIDGLRSTNDWESIKTTFLSDPIEGVILVITNNESIAAHCADTKDEVFNVKGLAVDPALSLFTKISWGSVKLDSSEEELSRRIMTKCGGLPKVITAIGEHNRSMANAYIGRKEALQDTYDNFMSLLETSSCLRGLFSWMQSYFDDCPDLLKPCIFYMSIFPSGHGIRRRRLLRRWIAEGYSRDTPGCAAEETGEKFFSNLVKLSIIQLQSQGKADVVQFNGFFREYIISRPMQDNLVFELEGHCSLGSQRAGQHITISRSWDRAKILFESMELSRIRSFTVFGEWRSFFMSANANMRLLRVLDLEDTLGVTNNDLKQIGKLVPRLKFLSLRGCKDITCLPSSLGDLRQLQTLDIKGTSIVTLPPTIIKLVKLQYVRAGATHSRSTPSEGDDGNVVGPGIPPAADGDSVSTSQGPAAAVASASAPPPTDADGASTSQPPPAAVADEAQTTRPWSSRPPSGLVLSWLSKFRRNGFVSSAHDGVQFPAVATGGIGKLRALHTLGVLSVEGESGKVVLREMKKLAQLRKLKLFGINRRNWQDFCFAISGHGYLESLSVRLDDNEQQDQHYSLDDISKPPKTLKSLKLYGGNVHASLLWIWQLEGLTHIDPEGLELTISTQEDIDSLMKLPCQNLYQRFCVKPIQDGELHYGWQENWWRGNQFMAAKILKIDCGSYRSEIVFGLWIPEFVEVLVVHFSTTEASLKLSRLDKLRNLKEVWLKGTYSEAVKQHLQDEVAKHDNKPVFKLEDQPRPS